MNLAMIVAIDSEGGIGIGNKLPWHCPEDLAYFKDLTEGNTVVMGMNTYKSLPMYPKGLPNRDNLVICRNPEEFTDSIEGVTFVTIEQVRTSTDKAWVIGGAKTYEALIDQIEMVSLTIIKGKHECDVYISINHYLAGKAEVEHHALSEKAQVSIFVNVEDVRLYKEQRLES